MCWIPLTQDVDPSIDRAQFGAVYWLPDSKTFSTIGSGNPRPGDARPTFYLDSRDYLHHVADDPEKGRGGIWEGPVFFGVEMDRQRLPYVGRTPGSKYAFGVIAHGVQNEATIYVTSLETLHDASASWRKIATSAMK